jgi:hypothetical protein
MREDEDRHVDRVTTVPPSRDVECTPATDDGAEFGD